MEKQRNSKRIAIIVLCVAVLGLTVAFAAMSTQLTIGGTAKMDTARWSIKFANLNLESKTGNASVVKAPDLTDTHIGDYEVTLTKPGDSVVYTFDVVNSGDINAILGTFTKQATPTCTGVSATSATADAGIVCGNLTYSLTYTDTGAAVTEGDTLDGGATKNMTLTISYDGNTLPKDDVTITGLDITMIYNQN